MRNRQVRHTVPVLAFLASVPVTSSSSEYKLSQEEASRAASELVQSVGPAYDCEISDIAITDTKSSGGESGYYFVSFRAIGPRCTEAHEVLNYRGRSKGLWFIRKPRPKRIDKNPEEPNLDLIHEIDPPMNAEI